VINNNNNNNNNNVYKEKRGEKIHEWTGSQIINVIKYTT
jgi:hypothetical protein